MKKLDSTIARHVTLATGALMLCPDAGQSHDDEISVMFLGGPEAALNMRADAAAIGAEKSMTVVLLEFKPGKERDGPSNIRVIGWREGVRHEWGKCTLWTTSTIGPFYIVSREEPLTFRFNGFHLRYVEDGPKQTQLLKGMKLAKAILRRAGDIELPYEVGRMIYSISPKDSATAFR